jgi:tetratricopeptide (TPR) repeat protein
MAALPLAFAACAIPPKDPFQRAEYALQDDDLLRALRAYDAVPVAHPRYPDARAAAVEVELRMRRCHELILEALMLRGEWRDAEALERLRRAQEHWPLQPSLQQWIAATEQRLQLFGERTAAAEVAASQPDRPAMPIVEVQPVGPAPQPMAEAAPPRRAARNGTEGNRTEAKRPAGGARAGEVDGAGAAAAAEVRAPIAERSAASAYRPPQPPNVAATTPSTRAPHEPEVVDREPEVVIARPVPTGEDPVALGLVSVEARLANGEREGAVHDLIELAKRFPDDRRVRRRLGPLLHQRALMNYGQGLVTAAVADWRRVLQLDPGNEVVQRLLDKAEAESGGSGASRH